MDEIPAVVIRRPALVVGEPTLAIGKPALVVAKQASYFFYSTVVVGVRALGVGRLPS